MKQRILIISKIALVVVMMVCLTSCGTTYQEATRQTKPKEESIGDGYFTVITSWGSANSYYIVYANDTKVKYFVMWTGYQYGITPLYNADGTLQIHEETDN